MPVQIETKKNQLLFSVSTRIQKIVFISCLALCLTSFISPAIALLMGLGLAQLTGHPYLKLNHKATNILLKTSVIGLGFGMNIHAALQTGKEGIIFTVFSILGTLLFGYLMGRWLNIEPKISYLICLGTAICGGSAIATIAPVIKAGEKQISVALGCVFVLNAIALFIFPILGHYFNLSQTQFGLWCAIAIHDTSSVVGAASKYGAHALEVATTVKLTRALWIIPISLISAFLFSSRSKKISMPYFIGLFVLVMLVNTYFPAITVLSPYIIVLANMGLRLTLFLIGAGLSRQILIGVGFRPLVQGLFLWIAISGITLYTVIQLG